MDQYLLAQYAIHRLPINTPFPIGSVNCYFVEEPVPTLIDVPPHGTSFLAELRSGLKDLGYALRDVGRIIVTHPHIDHFGSAAGIAAQSEAEVWVCREGAGWLENYEAELVEEERFSTEFLTSAAVPAAWVEQAASGFFELARELAQSVKPSRYLTEGDEVLLGPALFRFVAVPGHTPWCMLIYNERDRMAFTGDFLLREVSSNALCQGPHAAPKGYRSLKTYTASLRKVRELGLDLAFPGHGKAIESPSERIADLLAFIEERKEFIRDILSKGSQTPFQIMNQLFPGLPSSQLFLAISEIMGHLEVLEDEGLVKRLLVDDSVSSFQLTPAAGKSNF
ncbi:MAG TPA: MBL fold metallo-hydrolase [Syntrophorhabdales bacterium]|nr:MBL fold metallo-hydrolase [Syntrophorhabdales bacterium]